MKTLRQVIPYIFFSNYFYGLCAVALSVEATLQQRFPLNSLAYYVYVFCVTALYYTRAYITEHKVPRPNPRTAWYWNNRRAIRNNQLLFTAIVLIYLGLLGWKHYTSMLRFPLVNWILMLVFPFVAALYYGINHEKWARFKLRNIGWLKPFLIGFVWAGLVNVYPILFYNVENDQQYTLNFTGLFLFTKNFMFVTVLCIMFDIKDYAADHNHQLKTFVVKAGLRKTIFYILIPLCLAGFASFLYYALRLQFSLQKILLNTVPFVLLILVAYSLHQRKSIFYYLIVIDGLMLVKAACGIFAMLFF